jgi:hypothetical protein
VGRGDADVVHHQLDRPAPGQLGGQVGAILGVEVGLHDLAGLAAEHLLDQGVPVDHGDVGPHHDQPLGDRLADAPGGSGYDGSTPPQVAEHIQRRRAGII